MSEKNNQEDSVFKFIDEHLHEPIGCYKLIIGSNGSGKTSFLRYLYNRYKDKVNVVEIDPYPFVKGLNKILNKDKGPSNDDFYRDQLISYIEKTIKDADIVIADNIGQGLHVGLQKQMFDYIRERARTIKFVMTSHSPISAMGCYTEHDVKIEYLFIKDRASRYLKLLGEI